MRWCSEAVTVSLDHESLRGLTWQGHYYPVTQVWGVRLLGREVGYRVASGQQMFELHGDPASTTWTLDGVPD